MRRLYDYTCRSGSSLLLSLLFAGCSYAAGNDDCVPLVTVNVETSSLLNPADAQTLIDPMLGVCIDARLVQEILSTISAYLIEQGYVTSRPYLLEQDINDGEIEVKLLIGIIEAVIDADSGSSNASIAGAFAFNGEVLNLRELETALEAIERPQSVQASFEIRPGSQQGGSVIAIKTVKSSPFRVELGANARTDIDAQLSLRATLDNPLNINDVIEFRYNSGDVFQAYQSDRSSELGYSVAVGSYLLSYSHSDLTYKQRVQGFSGSLESEGDSVSNRLWLEKLMSRGQAYRFNLGLGLELEDSSNSFEGERIDVSSYKTSKVAIELGHDWFAGWGQLATNYVYQQGLDAFGARDDNFFNEVAGVDSDARLQFQKHTLNSQLYYYLPNPSWYIDLNLFLQHSDDILYNADKLFLGSENTVRGYTWALSGSNGWYGRSDLVKRFQSVVNPFSGTRLSKSISLSLGIDYGEIRCEIDNPDLCGEIYGLGAGLVISDDNFNALLSWGHPLKELDDDIGSEDIFLLDLRWGL